MAFGVIKTEDLIKQIPSSQHAKTWRQLRMFMAFFLVGYLVAIGLLILKYTEVILMLTGAIFFLGAVFVVIVVITGKSTIIDLKHSMISNDEKKVMLKEIHHRVKNNLQIISSLLRLQAIQITDEKTAALFEECQNRVAAMSLIHEMLYQTDDLRRINLKGYIEELSDKLNQLYGFQKSISLNIDVIDYKFGIDTLLPLGLLLSEILTNSFKYAFADMAGGIVHVTLEAHKGDHFELLIGDNGKGIGNARQADSNSLGMELIDSLVNQLDGSVELLQEKGTVYKIIFKEQVKGVTGDNGYN